MCLGRHRDKWQQGNTHVGGRHLHQRRQTRRPKGKFINVNSAAELDHLIAQAVPFVKQKETFALQGTQGYGR